MIKHIVLWKLKPEAKATQEIYAANMERQKARFQSMLAESPMMRSLTVYPGVGSGPDIYDFAVVMEFDSRESLNAFQTSPTHKDPKAREFGMSIREKKAVIDIESP